MPTCAAFRDQNNVPDAFTSTSPPNERPRVFRLTTRPLLIIPHLWLSRSSLFFSFLFFSFLKFCSLMIPSRALDRLAFSLSLSLLSKNCIWRLSPPRVFNNSWMLFCDRLTCSSDEDVSRRNLMSVDVGRGRTWRCSEERPWCFLSLTSSLTYVYSWFWLHIGTLIRHHDMKIPFLFLTFVFIACFRR